jgi:hypothetical protein
VAILDDGIQKADRSKLTVVEYVRGLVNDYVIETGVAAAKVLDRDVACDQSVLRPLKLTRR